MKKIALIILTMITMPSYATTMCAANDTVAIVLDPTIEKTDSFYEPNTLTWHAQFPYGTLHGKVACINKGEGISTTKTESVLKDDRYNDGTMRRVIGGERYGRYCWAHIEHPVVSEWMYYMAFNNAGDCVARCGGMDWYNFSGQLSTVMQSSLFKSIIKK